MSLNNTQIRFLKAQAHSLKSVVIVGAAGISDGVLNEINQTLEVHELIKVRVNANDRLNKKNMIEQIADQTESACIQTIGHIGTFYRPRKKNPFIQLPK
jgi:RNA-binding protein